MPHNILESTFVYVASVGLFSFGGLTRDKNGKILFNKKVFLFNMEKLTWDTVSEIPEERINPKTVISSCKNYVYLIGGIIMFNLG